MILNFTLFTITRDQRGSSGALGRGESLIWRGLRAHHTPDPAQPRGVRVQRVASAQAQVWFLKVYSEAHQCSGGLFLWGRGRREDLVGAAGRQTRAGPQ